MATIRRRGRRYEVQVRRKGHSPVSRSFSRLSDAREWARTMETRADRGDLAPDRSALRSITLADLIKRYRDEVLPDKKGGEFETIMLNAFLRHRICRKTLDILTPADFAAWRDERTSRAKTNRPITLKSAKRILSPIQRLIQVAMDEWEIPLRENPVARLNLNVKDNRRERRLREGELARIVEAAESNRNPYILPIVLFALETAMRRGEILAMCWQHVDLKRLSVAIPESKNGYSRMIPLTDRAKAILLSIAGCRSGGDQPSVTVMQGEIYEKRLSNGIVDTSRVFNWNSNNRISEKERIFPVSAMAVRMAWDRLMKRAGIVDLHFHDLRHEAISRYFELGLTVPEVASISGHRDLRMLMRYAHADLERIRMRLRKI